MVDRATAQINKIAQAFNQASGSAGGLHSDMEKFHGQLQRIESMGNVGERIFHGAKDFLGEMLTPAKELTTQISRMSMASVSAVEQVKNLQAAWTTVQAVPESDIVGSLKRINEFSQILGRDQKGFAEARGLLTQSAKAQAVFLGLTGSEDQAEAQAFATIRMQEMRGKFKQEELFSALEKSAQAATAMQGMVLPTDKLQFIKYARQMKMSLDDDFIFGGGLDVLLMEMKNAHGGGTSTVGVMAQALGRTLIQGTMNKATHKALESFGLIGPSAQVTGTAGTTVLSPIKDAALLSQNPAEWIKKDFIPVLEARGYKTPEQQNLAIMQVMRGAGTFTSMIQELVNKHPAFEREHQNIARQMPLDKLYEVTGQTNPDVAFHALDNAWKDLRIAFAENIVPVVIPAIHELAAALQKFADYAKDHPDIGKVIIDTAIGLAAVGGTLAALGVAAGTVQGLMVIGSGLAAVGEASAMLASGALLPALGAALSGLAVPALVLTAALGGVYLAVTHWTEILQFAQDHIGALRLAWAGFLLVNPEIVFAIKSITWLT